MTRNSDRLIEFDGAGSPIGRSPIGTSPLYTLKTVLGLTGGRSLARIFHVRVIARQRDPDSHRVILIMGVTAT
jgi:hypothetical protein